MARDTAANAAEAKLTRSTSALKGNSFGLTVGILVQYALGMAANLWATLPAKDHGKSVFAAFGAAISSGPAVVMLHALLGTLLIIGSIAAVVRAVRIGRGVYTLAAVIALLAILDAWISGARFVGTQNDATSYNMAVAAAVAMLCYVVILFVPARES